MYSLPYGCVRLLIISALSIWAASVDAATIRLNWQQTSANETGFKIERLAGSSYVQIASVAADIQSYTDSGLTAGNSYCYRVRAFNTVGSSSPSNTACATATETATSSPIDSGKSTLTTSPTLSPTTSPLGGKWTDYRLSVKIRSADDDAMGVMFRYRDNQNYYRFSWYPQIKTRRLEKQVAGTFTTLAQDTAVYTTGQTYTLGVLAQGSSLKILIDGKTIFSVTDTSFPEGSMALYSFYNAGSSFDDVMVTDLTTGNVLLSANFDDGSHRGWTFIDETNESVPSQWSAASGALVQSSNIGSSLPGARGTYALYLRDYWQDYRATLKMRSADDDALGVLFRFQDPDNYYRFSWGRQVPGRRLFKRENGIYKLLAEDAIPFVVGQKYSVELVAQGSTLKINIDGASVLTSIDTSFRTGTIALYSSYDQGAYFDDVHVEDLATKRILLSDNFNDGNFLGWTVIDEAGTIGGPSDWAVVNGEAVQRANIGSDAYGSAGSYLIY